MLGAAGRVCIGCDRTLDEIAAWSRLTPAEKAAILDRLAERRANFRAD